jgi:NAD(P)-dependent dehydrogenase (short-subunit alcohol dehydrogenase family)
MNLEGKTALIIGAGRGIGRCAAERFSEAGANIVIASRTEPELLELEYKLNTKGNQNILPVECDAANESEVAALVESAKSEYGSIDYLVLAAGMGVLKPFAELTADDLEIQFRANVKTAFNVLQAVLPVMSEQKFGRVVAIPGILGKAPMMQASAYCASKYALTGMIKCLAQEYKRHGIRFSLMHFGGVDSGFWDNIGMKVQRDKMLTIEAAANAVFFAATQEGEGVMAEIVLMPENHQLV